MEVKWRDVDRMGHGRGERERDGWMDVFRGPFVGNRHPENPYCAFLHATFLLSQNHNIAIVCTSTYNTILVQNTTNTMSIQIYY